uniref:Nucleotide-diphospho-sugar transferase domain-containing protein n=1 Tax=Entomoneis paludosa TaxID=265537 RepID=A0A7S2YKX3_9STRA|mmetsp:Transcript_37266/g.77339  ORF Transcript_37266/g.77339 Transcript_37266/m.77339 type:complete len:416 (+) Transcript_37266:89-1336(+)
MANISTGKTNSRRRSPVTTKTLVWLSLAFILIFRASETIRTSPQYVLEWTQDTPSKEALPSSQTSTPRFSADPISTAPEEAPPPPPIKPFDDKRAIFLISMGEKAANGTLVERFLWSARNIGKYNGWIILLTDAPHSRYDHLQLSNNNKNHDTNTVDDKFVILNPSLHENPPKPVFTFDAMNFKIYKTYVLEYLDRDSRFQNVELVYYLDVDIVFGNALQRFFDYLEREYEIKAGPQPKVWMFEGHEKRRKIPQGGQMILHRKAGSQTCLNEWRASMMTNFEDLADQSAMKRLIKSPERKCEFVLMKREARYIQFPETADIEDRVGFLQNHTRRVPKARDYYGSLVHFRNTALVMKDTSAEALEYYMRDIMGFQPGQPDEFGITTKVLMSTPKIKKLNTDTQVHLQSLSAKDSSN